MTTALSAGGRSPVTLAAGAGATSQATSLAGSSRTGLLTTPLRDRFGVTLRVAIHVPAEAQATAAAQLATLFQELEERLKDERGFVRVEVDVR